MLILMRLIMWPFSLLLYLMYLITGSYGWSIVLFAVAIKLIMLYPSAKSKRNTMHAVHEGYLMDQFAISMFNQRTDEYGGPLENRLRFARETVEEIKKRCGNDQERYAMEIQKLYQSEHVNPLGGCLWSFLPLPILIALYGIIRRPVLNFMLINMARPEALEKVEALKQALINIGYEFPQSQQAYEEIQIAKGIFEHPDAMQAIVPQVFPIDFNFLGFIDLTAIPWSAFGQLQQGNVSLATFALILIPIVSGLLNLALSVVSMRTSINTDPAMKSQQTMMMVMMPLMSVYIGFILPASLGIYWIAMSVFSIVQELILQKYYGAKLDKEEAAREEAARQDRIRRMEAAKNRPQVQDRNTSKEKRKRQNQSGAAPQKKKKNSTTEAGRVGDRPYARGRSFGNHYDELDEEPSSDETTDQ